MNNCIFCKIANKEIPSYKVYEDKDILAILDINPAAQGQTLVMPKKHYNYIFDINDKEYSNLLLKTKLIANAIDSALKPLRTCIVVEGFEVEHVHVRLHPAYKRFLELRPIEKPSEKEFKNLASKIKSLLK